MNKTYIITLNSIKQEDRVPELATRRALGKSLIKEYFRTHDVPAVVCSNDKPELDDVYIKKVVAQFSEYCRTNKVAEANFDLIFERVNVSPTTGEFLLFPGISSQLKTYPCIIHKEAPKVNISLLDEIARIKKFERPKVVEVTPAVVERKVRGSYRDARIARHISYIKADLALNRDPIIPFPCLLVMANVTRAQVNKDVKKGRIAPPVSLGRSLMFNNATLKYYTQSTSEPIKESK
jgi:hypothetical protein